MKIKIIIFLFFIFIFNIINNPVSLAQDNDEPNSNDYEDTEFGRDHYKRDLFYHYDTKLNEIYNGILKIYRDDTLFIRNLKIAQKAWMVYRDAHVVSKYGYTQVGFLDSAGILFSGCLDDEFIGMIKNRIDELNVWFEGYDYHKGELCPNETESTVKDKEEVDKIKSSMNKTKKSRK
jgi:uncharacterized protein YecT (DUF1311 family)